MIPAPLGITARYRQQTTKADGSAYEYIDTMPVIAFDDEGEPLVLGKKRLVPASTYGNFVDIGQGKCSELASIIPAVGWRVEFTDPDTGAKHSNPLFGWGLCVDGDITPLDVDERGWVEQLHDSHGQQWRLYHTDADPQPV